MPRRYAWWPCVAVLAFLFVDSRPVRADWLSWSAPPGCAQREAISAAIDAQLARRGEDRSELAVAGAVRQRGQEFVLELKVSQSGRPAQRSLSASNCEALADAAVLLVVLSASAPDEPRDAIAAPLAGTPSPGTDASEPAPAASPALPVSAPVEPQTSSPPESSEATKSENEPEQLNKNMNLGAFAPDFAELGFTFGVWGAGLPAAQLSGALRGGLAWGPWIVQLELAGTAPRSRTDPRVGELRTYGLSAALSACFMPIGAGRHAAWSVAPCLSVSAVRTHAEARDLLVAQARTSSWWLGGLALEGSVRLVGPLRARLELGLGLPLSARPGFSVEGAGMVERAHLVSAFGRAGLGLRF